MGLEFVIGGSGYGKSTAMYREIAERSVKEKDNNFIIVVPEQYTMQIQKKITAMHERHGVINVDILSFQRLAHRIFEELGKPSGTILGETEKVMFIRRILKDCAGELKVFGGNADKKGFAEEVKSMLSEFIQYDVSVQDIAALSEKLKDSRASLSGKLSDMALIFRKFREMTGKDYMTTEELLVACRDVIEDSGIVRNSFFWFDEFTGFTPIQTDIVEKIIRVSRGVKVALTVDDREEPFSKASEEELFGLTKETIEKLERICRENHIKRDGDRDLILNAPLTDKKSRGIAALERNLFRSGITPYDDKPEDVKLTECTDINEEAYFIAQEIDRLVKQEGCRYRDFAVITPDPDTYRRFFEKNFKHFNIPHFMDDKRSIEGNAYVEFIRGLFEVRTGDFAYDPVFSFLKTGLTDISDDEIDAIDNYVLRFGIRGHKAWEAPFTRNDDYDPVDLEPLNDIRQRVCGIFAGCEKTIFAQGLTVADRCRGLAELADRMDIHERLLKASEELLERGLPARAQEYERVYDAVSEILSGFSAIMGDDVMSLKEFTSILEEGFSNVKLGVVPSVQDETVVGDIRRTRLADVKVLFFAGMNDNLVPAQLSAGGVLNDRDKKVLKEFDITLSPDRQKKACEERFYLYTILSRPDKKLYITFSRTGADNKPLRPSGLINKIKEVLPKLEAEKCPGRSYEGDPLFTVAEGLSGKEPKGSIEQFRQAVAFLKSGGSDEERLLGIAGGAFSADPHPALSDEAIAAAADDGVLCTAVTALEKYASCKYRFFAEYTLGLQERKELKLRQLDLGNIYHKAFEILALSMEEKGISWQDISAEELEKEVDLCIEKAFEKYDTAALTGTALDREVMRSVRRVAKNVAAVLKYQMDNSDFTTREVEKSIYTKPIDLGNGKKLVITGKLDRMDTCDAGNGRYIKLIDYKSGQKTFNLKKVYEGRDLQLFLYMNEISERLKKEDPGTPVVPAAAFYMKIDDPFVDCFGADEEEIWKERLKELKPSGIVNSDYEVIAAMDRRMEDGFISDIIPVGLKKTGGFNGIHTRAKADTEKMRLLEHHVKRKAKEMALEISDGMISADPYKEGSQNSCTYCPYKTVCSFNANLAGFSYRRPEPLDNDVIWERIEQEEEANG